MRAHNPMFDLVAWWRAPREWNTRCRCLSASRTFAVSREAESEYMNKVFLIREFPYSISNVKQETLKRKRGNLSKTLFISFGDYPISWKRGKGKRNFIYILFLAKRERDIDIRPFGESSSEYQIVPFFCTKTFVSLTPLKLTFSYFRKAVIMTAFRLGRLFTASLFYHLKQN